MTKYQLEVEYDYDFILIGICCHAKDYRLCWALNNQLTLKLEKEEDLKITLKNKTEANNYSIYGYYNEENHTSYSLIGNRGDHNFLIPEQKQADFFLMIKDNFEHDIKELMRQIRAIDFVLTAYEVQDIDQLKSKQNLLF